LEKKALSHGVILPVRVMGVPSGAATAGSLMALSGRGRAKATIKREAEPIKRVIKTISDTDNEKRWRTKRMQNLPGGLLYIKEERLIRRGKTL